MKKLTMFLFGVVLIFGLTTNASAIPFYFDKLETNTELPGSQFSGEVTSDVAGQVGFTISNSGPTFCTIFTVYFDDSLAVLSDFLNLSFLGSQGSFYAANNSGTLSGGQNADPPFANPADWVVDRLGAAANGVDPDEALTITFSAEFNPVITALELGDLRIGLHVGRIGFEEKSDSFITTGAPIPEPATMLLMGFGLFGLGVFGRKKFLKSA